jgi:2-(1,2-epoxy-1,2-dihydrophenyl)acetyl-CoA isomerase
MMAGYESVEGLRLHLDGCLLRIKLDRPDKKNALHDGMVAAMIDALETANNDERVRAVLLTGAGDDFCAGADIIDRNNDPTVPRRAGSIQRRLPGTAHRLIPLMTEVQIPVVCAARGWAAGIGLHLVLASDFAVVALDSRLWEPFSSRGFTPDSGGSWLLPRLVGVARARELLLLGERIDGRTAVEWGLVHRATDADNVEPQAEELARTLGEGPTVMLGLTKWLINSGLGAPLRDHLANEAFAMELSSRSKDFREGLTAFATRRRAEFKGT